MENNTVNNSFVVDNKIPWYVRALQSIALLYIIILGLDLIKIFSSFFTEIKEEGSLKILVYLVLVFNILYIIAYLFLLRTLHKGKYRTLVSFVVLNFLMIFTYPGTILGFLKGFIILILLFVITVVLAKISFKANFFKKKL